MLLGDHFFLNDRESFRCKSENEDLITLPLSTDRGFVQAQLPKTMRQSRDAGICVVLLSHQKFIDLRL